MMRMAVCMKQVPGDIGKSLSADGRICRNASSSIINPADVFSLETALTLKEQQLKRNFLRGKEKTA